MMIISLISMIWLRQQKHLLSKKLADKNYKLNAVTKMLEI